MKRSTNKKGFTIVELVIVIAVIAILAAVLIPTFASLVEKANRSADIQAVRQMNTALAANEATEGKSIDEVYAALTEAGMSAKDYIPLTDGNLFFWLKDENRIVYTDEKYNVIFPENYEEKNLPKDFAGKYLSLGGLITEEEVEVNGGKATVKNVEQLYYLANHSTNVTEITIDADSIDLVGANISFSVEPGKSLTIKGKEGENGGTTLTGLVMLDSKYTDSRYDKDYASGFVAEVGDSQPGAQNSNASLTLSNITISGAQIGGLEIGGVGALIGRINNNTKATISNCHVIDTVVNGKNKVGALVGSVAGCGENGLKIENCTAKNVTVNCSEGESALVVGNVYNGGTVECADLATLATDCTLNLVEGDHTRETKTGKLQYTYNKNNTTQTGAMENVTIVRVWDDKKNQPEVSGSMGRYRIFDKNALITYQGSSVTTIQNAITTAQFGTEGTDISVNVLWNEQSIQSVQSAD